MQAIILTGLFKMNWLSVLETVSQLASLFLEIRMENLIYVLEILYIHKGYNQVICQSIYEFIIFKIAPICVWLSQCESLLHSPCVVQ